MGWDYKESDVVVVWKICKGDVLIVSNKVDK